MAQTFCKITDKTQEKPETILSPVPPLGLSVMALITLFHLCYGQIWVQPVDLLRFQVFESQSKAARILHIWAQAPTVQNRLDDGLMKNETINCLDK